MHLDVDASVFLPRRGSKFHTVTFVTSKLPLGAKASWPSSLPLAAEDALTPNQAKRKETLRLDDQRDFRDNAIVVVNTTQPGTAAGEEFDSDYTVKLCARSPGKKSAQWGSSYVP